MILGGIGSTTTCSDASYSPKSLPNSAGYVSGYSVPQVFTRFPVNLAELYGSYSGITDPVRISPFAFHTYRAHVDGNFCWYLWTDTLDNRVGVYMPAKGKILEVRSAHCYGEPWCDESLMEIEGVQALQNYHIEIEITENVTIKFGHIVMLKSFYDTYKVNDIVEAGIQIGYGPNLKDPIPGAGEVDFEVADENFMIPFGKCSSTKVCPLEYFPDSVQAEINDYWYKQDYPNYEKQGIWPECSLCSDGNINLPGTCWGSWRNMNDTNDETYDTLLSLVNLTAFGNPETFSNAFVDGLPLNVTPIGTINQRNPTKKEDFVESTFGGVGVTRVSGNDQSGIFNSTRNETPVQKQYIRYEITAGTYQYGNEDVLVIEGFDTLAAAQAGFTSAKLYYIRDLFYPQDCLNDDDNEGGDIGFNATFLLAGMSILGIIIVFWHTRNKLSLKNRAQNSPKLANLFQSLTFFYSPFFNKNFGVLAQSI